MRQKPRKYVVRPGHAVRAAAVVIACIAAGQAEALLINPSVDYRLESGARLGEARDSDIKDAFVSGFTTFSDSVMATLPGAVTTSATQTWTVGATQVSGTLGAAFSASSGDGGATSRIVLDASVDQPVYLTLSGSGEGTPPGRPSLAVIKRFPDTVLLNLNAQQIDLDTALSEPLLLQPGIYRFNLSVSSGTQRNGGVLMHTSGQGDLDFTLDFAAAVVPGDTDGDGDIDNTDLGTAIGNFTGPVGAAGGKDAATGDADGDGDVDNTDLGLAIQGFTGPNPTPVPEPATAAMLALGAAFVTRRRHASS